MCWPSARRTSGSFPIISLLNPLSLDHPADAAPLARCLRAFASMQRSGQPALPVRIVRLNKKLQVHLIRGASQHLEEGLSSMQSRNKCPGRLRRAGKSSKLLTSAKHPITLPELQHLARHLQLEVGHRSELDARLVQGGSLRNFPELGCNDKKPQQRPSSSWPSPSPSLMVGLVDGRTNNLKSYAYKKRQAGAQRKSKRRPMYISKAVAESLAQHSTGFRGAPPSAPMGHQCGANLSLLA